jgi:hypothetical protein
MIKYLTRYWYDKQVKMYNGGFHIRDLMCNTLILDLIFVQLTAPIIRYEIKTH